MSGLLDIPRGPGQEKLSLAEIVASWSAAEQQEFFRRVRQLLTPEQQLRLEHDWRFWGRPAQFEPNDCDDPECGCYGNWTVWCVKAGRAFGKTRCGAETVHDWAEKYRFCRIALVAPTNGDARRVMIDGDSGILATQKPWNKCVYWPSLKKVVWENGTTGWLFSAEEASRLRGPQHHFAWCDEIAAWSRVQEVWDMLRLGLRLPRRANWALPYRPRIVVTTTPTPTEFIRRMCGGRGFRKADTTHVTGGTTYDNRSNLAAEFFESVISDLEGTRLGAQELEGLILEDVPGALWKSEMIENGRIAREDMPHIRRVAIAVDPSAGGEAETGIMVCGIGSAPTNYANAGRKMHGYLLEDRSLKASPDNWGRAVVKAYEECQADVIVAEANMGGDMVASVIKTVNPNARVVMVHATRSKQVRAEPIVALYEQRRVHHVGSMAEFRTLENQLVTWDPLEDRKSPDRLDALVWGMSYLLGKGKQGIVGAPIAVAPQVSPWAMMR